MASSVASSFQIITRPTIAAVIPAVRGEHYVYTCELTEDKPVYALMKCKSNKTWASKDLECLGREANLFFVFDACVQATVHSIKTVKSLECPKNVAGGFIEIWVADACIDCDTFYDICEQKDADALSQICDNVCASRETVLELARGMLVALKTETNKYGLFHVKEITSTSVLIDAYHIWL